MAAAKAATDAFAGWLEAQAPSKTGPSGVGVENYDWYLKNVQLVPYTWRDEVVLMERELTRARGPPCARGTAQRRRCRLQIADRERRRARAALRRRDHGYMAFLKDRQISHRPRLHGACAARQRSAGSDPGPREFFTEVDYRDPEVMRTHGYHWFDLAQMVEGSARRPDPPRRRCSTTSSYTRTEGHATGWEEMMMQAGMFDARPRSRELVYILLAQRAARALGDLRMHANQMTLEQAAAFASANTPRGWLRLDGNPCAASSTCTCSSPPTARAT